MRLFAAKQTFTGTVGAITQLRWRKPVFIFSIHFVDEADECRLQGGFNVLDP